MQGIHNRNHTMEGDTWKRKDEDRLSAFSWYWRYWWRAARESSRHKIAKNAAERRSRPGNLPKVSVINMRMKKNMSTASRLRISQEMSIWRFRWDLTSWMQDLTSILRSSRYFRMRNLPRALEPGLSGMKKSRWYPSPLRSGAQAVSAMRNWTRMCREINLLQRNCLIKANQRIGATSLSTIWCSM